jgi:hypothetical protein
MPPIKKRKEKKVRTCRSFFLTPSGLAEWHKYGIFVPDIP